MDGEGAGSDGSSYYSVLGLRRDASANDIRAAYRKLAMKWHPDRWARDPKGAGEANRRFQRIQEAYSVLSDTVKRTRYDVGVFDPYDEDDDVEGFEEFVEEMVSMMAQVDPEKPNSMEDLQKMLDDIINGGDGGGCDGGSKRGSADVPMRGSGGADGPKRARAAAGGGPRSGDDFFGW